MPTQQSWISLILIVGLLKIGFRYAYITLMIQFNINRWFAHGWMVSSMPNQQSWFNLILIVGLYTLKWFQVCLTNSHDSIWY